jgi:phosphatidyl-myo-inositol alpha-mannosyltransferase
MKIGFVLDDSLDKPDGVQQYILTLGQWIVRQGHEVHYLVGQTKRTDIKNIHSLSKNLGVNFNQNRMSIPFPANRQRLKQLLLKEKFDVLHIQTPHSPMLGARIVKFAPKSTAIIATFHIVPFSRLEAISARLLGLYLWRNLRRVDVLIGASKPAAKAAHRAYRRKAVVVTNTVDVESFKHGHRLKQLSDGKFNIIYLGRLVPRKGAQQFLEAIQELHLKHHLDNVRVLICGKGQQRDQLQKYINDHHLQHQVHMTGFISEIEKPDYLASADIAVFPSLGGECFGIVLIEAMAAGSQVVIGGDNVGYRSVLGDQPTQIFNPLDTKRFAATIRHFLLSSQARNKAHKWQIKEVEKYDVKTIGLQLLDIYSKVIAKRSGYADNKHQR